MTVHAARAVPTTVKNVETAIIRHGDFGHRWLEGLWRGDPLADAVVSDFTDDIGHATGMGMLRRAISGGIGSVENPPDSLRALFAQLDAEPDWVDHDRCDRASRSLARQSREYGLVLGAASLVAGAGNHVAGKPLRFTGRYATQAAVRSIEVGSWLTEITTAGGLQRTSLGFEHTVRVRMIHAMVRGRLNGHDEWDHAAWGLPIPQPYMAFTLAEFGSVALRAMHQLGVRYTDSELDDIYHLWRCVGRLVGTAEDFNPRTEADHLRIEDLYALTSPGSDEADQHFVAALTEFQATELAKFMPPGPWRKVAPKLMAGYQRAFIGDAAANALAIPETRLKHLPRIAGPVRAAAFRTHDRLVPGGKSRRTARGTRLREEDLVRIRADYDVSHQLVDDAPPSR